MCLREVYQSSYHIQFNRLLCLCSPKLTSLHFHLNHNNLNHPLCTERTAGYLDAISDSAHAPNKTDIGKMAQTEHTSQHPMTTRSKAGIRKPNPRYVLLSQKVAHPEPETVAEALKHPGWNAAMTEEIDNCKETKTFSLVP